MELEPVIGLEIHTQLNTQTKLFCACPTTFGAAPNQNTCPVCLGLPGALPALNARVLTLAIRLGLAVHCTIRRHSEFARKNYFYPDLPKAYQISQYDLPLCEHGWVEFDVPADAANGRETYTKRVNIIRIHMEEDAGKLVHDGGSADTSYVDLNRAGVPLVEIVSAPELATAQEARCYMETMHSLVTHLGVSRGNLEQGNLRADANVSLRPRGSTTLGTRTETKNINSFRFLEQAVRYEISRQAEELQRGGKIIQETRLFDSLSGSTHPMRTKEDADDYRYFPDPDLRPVCISEAQIAEIRQQLPELPAAKAARYREALGLSAYDAEVLIAQPELAALFDATVQAGAPPKRSANWVNGEVAARLNEDKSSPASLRFSPQQLAELILMIEHGELSSTSAKSVFEEMHAQGTPPAEIVEKKGLRQVSDESQLLELVGQILAASPQQVAQYKAGKERVFGYFVGQLMQQTKGQANPSTAARLFKERLQAAP